MKTMLFAVLFALLSGCNLGAIDQPVNSNADPVDPNVCTPACGSDQLCEAGVCKHLHITVGAPSNTLRGSVGGAPVTATFYITIEGDYVGSFPVTLQSFLLGGSRDHKYVVSASPETISESGPVTVTMTPGDTVEKGNIVLVIGSLAGRSAWVEVTAAPVNDYSLHISCPSGTFTMDQTETDTSCTMQVKKESGSPGDVTFQPATSSCSGLTATVSPDTSGVVHMDTAQPVRIVASNAQTGSCKLTFVGKDTSGQTRSIDKDVIVNGQVVTNDYSLTLIPASTFSFAQNATDTSYSIKATKISGAPGQVTMQQVTSSCTGLFATINPSTVNMGSSSPITIVASNAQVGDCKLVFTGTDTTNVTKSVELHGTITAPVVNNDYALSVTPAGAFSMNQNATDTTHSLKATLVSGTPGTVTVQQVVSTCSGLSATLSPNTVPMGGSTPITITTSAVAQTGACKLTFVGKDIGGNTKSVDFNVTVNGPVVTNDYVLTVTPSDAFSMNQNATDTTHSLKATQVSGTPGNVTFQQVVSTCTGLTATVSQGTVSMGSSTPITIVASSAQTGACKLTFVGTDTISVTKSVDFGLTVVVGDFNQSVTPSTFSVVQGQSGKQTVTVSMTVNTGVPELVTSTISLGASCSGVTTSQSTASAMSNTSYTFDVNVATTAAVETCTVTVKGISPSMPNGKISTVTATVTPASGTCTSDANCSAGQYCNLISAKCETSGVVSPFGTCSVDADCAPGICLASKKCSYWRFSQTCTVDVARYECYSNTGFTKPILDVKAGTEVVSDMTLNEATCLAVGTDYTKCTTKWFTGTSYMTGQTSGTYTPGSAQSAWNGPPK